MKTKLLILLALCVTGISNARETETWLTGTPFVTKNRLLMFRLDAPIEGNSGGAVVKLGVAKNATSFFPALEAAAKKEIMVRLYGRIGDDDTLPPNYSGPPLPSMSFIVWKAHMPNEKDTWDPGQKHQNIAKDDVLIDNQTGKIVASKPAATSQPAGTMDYRLFEVPKNTPLRRDIILGIRDRVYNNNRSLSIQNPRHVEMTFAAMLCDGQIAVAKLTNLTAEGQYHDPSPILLFLRQNQVGNWYIYQEVNHMTPQEKEVWVSKGAPRYILP